jgi:hypothetical protein
MRVRDSRKRVVTLLARLACQPAVLGQQGGSNMAQSPTGPADPKEGAGNNPPLAAVASIGDGYPNDPGRQLATRLLSRAEAAKAFDVSVTTFRRRYEGHTLQPIVGPDGAHYFRQEAVEELVIQKRGAAAVETFDAELAVTAFRLFEEGTEVVDVVLRLKVHPRTVAAIHREWVSLRGGYVVPGEVAREIEALPWMLGSRPVDSGAQLLENLKRSAPRRSCRDCNDVNPEICAECAKRLSVMLAERRATEARERAELSAHSRAMRDWDEMFKARTRK